MASPICTLVTEGHDAITAILAIGTLMIILFIFRWSIDSRKRLQEHSSVISAPANYLIPAGRDESFLNPENLEALPSVAFVMPVKWNSIKTASPVDNWRSQVLTAYQGKQEYLFVVESKDDGAVPVLEALQDEFKEQGKDIRIVVAGLSTSCTQKIHNMLAGVNAASADTEYVLFLDANSHAHPGTVSSLVSEMMDDPKIFVASGYPLDIPMAGATLWAWVMCQYRYLVISEFGQHRTNFPWGGAMLMRKAEIDNDVCEIKTRWLNGGYSDDLLVGGAALDHGRTVCTPLRALFPNPMTGDVTFSQAWDFIRRQAFTMTTFGSGGHCRAISLVMFAYACLKFIPGAGFLVALSMLSSLPMCSIRARSPDPLWSYDFALSMLFMVCFWYCMDVQKRYLQRCWKLSQSLSPGKKFTELQVTRWMQSVSLVLELLLSPFIALSIIRRRIWWGGILYHVWGGKVTKVERPSDGRTPPPAFSPTSNAAAVSAAKGRPLLAAEPVAPESAEMVALRMASAS